MKKLVLAILIGLVSEVCMAQMPPNLENGFKHWGSYDGGSLDTVNNLNGNQMLHAPLLPNYPQRGGKLTMQSFLYQTSKSWQVSCAPDLSGTTMVCQWSPGPLGVSLRQSEALTIQRTLHENGYGTGQISFQAFGYSILDSTGAMHRMTGSGPLDSTGEPTKFDSIDTTGLHMEMSNPDSYGVMTTATVTDRNGKQYVANGWIGGTDNGPAFCPQLPGNRLPSFSPSGAGLNIQPSIDDAPLGQQDCPQVVAAPQVTDSNGNIITLAGGVDTMGRTFAFFNGGLQTTDYSGCVSSHTISYATTQNYTAPDGTTQQLKLCYGTIPVLTAFNVSPFVEYQSNVQELVTVALADGTKWTFDYDNYGDTTFVGLPIGGSISYTWTTIAFPSCASPDGGVSRAVATRTVNDNNGNSYLWTYSWGNIVNNVISNTVTDPLNNDTVHVFTALDGTGAGYCGFFETRTQNYQGTGSSRQLVRQVDTTYSKAFFNVETYWGNGMGNVVPTDIQTTVYPSGKVSLIHKTYAPPAVSGGPISGKVATEREYDWGQGAPGPLLRETDTVYQWQKNSAYLTAGLLDLPASVVVISPNASDNIKSGCPINASGGTANCISETDYSYDEAGYLTTPVPAVNTQHNSTPPMGVRGNLTTVTRWLLPGGSAISSHTKWYDTGEPYQQIDPLGHTTTLSYDLAYAGAYVTQTCSPQTGSVTHCVSGTYDFNTGVLTSLTNENATTQASGNTPGDSGHTSNFIYDFQWRITSAQAPPDPANNNAQAQTLFNYSPPNTYPLSIQREKSVTNGLMDIATAYFDGLARSYQSQHSTPGGLVTVNTTFDGLGRPATVTNPFYSTSDPTYGITTNQYDALGRVTQVTKQDGSISKADYSLDNCTTSTDEAGKMRRACTDALGRLVEVDEAGVLGVTGNSANYASMQGDGNFVIYTSSSTALWGTFSTAQGPGTYWMQMQDDGNLAEYQDMWDAHVSLPAGPGPITSMSCTNIGNALIQFQTLQSGYCMTSPSGRYKVVMQTDGNLVDYDLSVNPAQPVWYSATWGHSGARAVMQWDGNFVIYDPANNVLWSTFNYSHASSYYFMVLQDDGNLMEYRGMWFSQVSLPMGPGPVSTLSCSGLGPNLPEGQALQSGSCLVSPSGRFKTVMQADGNLATYDLSVNPPALRWSAGTSGSPVESSVALVTTYQYDALGNLRCVHQKGTDHSPDKTCSDASVPQTWRPRTFSYDSLGRLLAAQNPESGLITYAYDADGNLLQKTSPAPNQTGAATQTITYCYDELHRVTGRAYGALSCPLASPVVSYTYDAGDNAKGKLTYLSDQAGTASYSYDILGRLTGETRVIAGVSKSLSYGYNLDGSLKTLTYPSGATVSYTPWQNGSVAVSWPQDAKDLANNINYVTGATYGPDGAIAGFVNGNTITNKFLYTPRLQPCRMIAATGGTLPALCGDAAHGNVLDLGYDFHAGNGTAGSGSDNGNVYGITNYKDSSRNQSFTYDQLNRLISAQNAGTNCGATTVNGKTEYWGNTYAYDAWGNLLQKTITKCSAENLSVIADTRNWIHLSPNDYQYDSAGNMTSDPTDAVAATFDEENRIATASQGSVTTTYTYDADGNRVKKVNSTGSTLYWYMTPGIVGESDLAGVMKSEYVFFGGERVARRDLVAPAGVFYYFSDHLKTASVITDAAGNVKAESDYYPWGGELQLIANDSNHYKFTGKERDIESGLDYFGARYYSNGLGRFITPDWAAKATAVPYAEFADPQSLNLYTYVRNIPTTGLDPDGHCGNTFCQIAAGVAIGVGKFIFNNSPPGMAINGMRQAVHDLKAGPAATKARTDAQLKSAVMVGAAVAGNTYAQGQVATGVANAWNNASTTDKTSAVTQGVLTVATIAVTGAGSAGTATETTTLFRGVGSAEAASIESTGAFTPSPTGSEFKGFFFNESDASSFASRMTEMTGDTHSVVSGEAPTDLVNASPAHNAATEGPGVLIKKENLPQVKVKPDGSN